PKTGFAGWYQRQCHKMNRSGLQYVVTEDADGKESIAVFNPECLGDNAEKTVDTPTDGTAGASEGTLAQKVKQLEDPNNF
ncbi:MAG: sodium:proton antiporter, partial [Neisseriaceae bacterium]|nr:sodium:proton antiporter [Neisseriaceae bacterium]